MQDDKGFLWFGTDDGLAQFDGYQFTVFKHQFQKQKSLSNNVIRGIVQDSKGFIWISTEGGGMNVYDPKTASFASLLQKNLIPSQKTGELLLDSQGRLWVSTPSDGIYRISSNSSATPKNLDEFIESLDIKHYTSNNSGLSDNKIWQLFEDSQSRIWIGTYDQGVQSLDPQTGKFTSMAIDHHGKRIRSVKTFFEDSKGNLWAGTEHHGVFIKASGKSGFVPFDSPLAPLREENITSFLEDQQGHLWIGTLGGGLYVFEPRSRQMFHYDDNPADPYSLNGQSVYTMLEDREGNIWIGMYSGEGLNKINPASQHFEHYRPQANEPGSLSGKMVKSLLMDHDRNLWAGIFNGGLNVKIATKEQFSIFSLPTRQKEITKPNVQVIFEDTSHQLWIGTDGSGLYKYNPATKAITSFHHSPDAPNSLSKDEVWAIVEDHKGLLWIGTANGGGLNVLDPKTGKFSNFLHRPNDQSTPSFNDVRSLLIDSKNRLWIGTYGGGLNRYDFDTQKFTYFRHDDADPESISHDIVTTIYEDRKGNLWVGTFGGGLNRMNPETGNFVQFRENDGLPSDVIKAVLEDDSGQLWISTVKGLTAFNPEIGTFKNYTAEDGLQSNEFNLGSAFKAPDGKMYFGGTNGFNAFLPDQINLPENPHIPILTKLRVLNQLVHPGDTIENEVLLAHSISYTDELTLNHRHNSFELEFSSLEYNQQEKINYAYKLEGFDKEWVSTDASRRYAAYSNLDAGEYVFRVKSTSENGLQNSEERLLHLRVLPPWYRSVAAYLIYFILFLLISYIVKSIITFRIRMKNDLRFERLEHQKQEEINQLKLRFFTNISHELRTPLMLIKVPLEQLIRRADLSQQVHHQLNSIHNNASRLLKLINQLLEFRKQETGHLKLEVQENDLKAFINNIYTSFEGLAKHGAIDFRLDMEKELPEKLWFDPDQMEKVLYNLCYNAFKFTPKGGKIRIHLSQKTIKIDQEEIVGVVITVEDNGKGIPLEHQDRIFERFFQIEDAQENFTAGTGIGLALSKNIVDFHHGKISMSSIPKQQTCFTVFLRTGTAHFAAHEMKRMPTESSPKKLSIEQELNAIDLHMLSSMKLSEDAGPIDSGLQNQKLLLVEDNEELLSLMKGVLQSHFTIITAPNGEEGIKMAQQGSPDIIISDVMMPKMDGVEMCGLLKKDLATSHIPVILLTARSAYDYQKEGYASGADDYLSKPFPLDLLITKVRNLLFTREKLKQAFRQKPDLAPSDITVSPADADLMEKAIQVVEKHMDDTDFDISGFVKEMGMSRTLLFAKLKAITDHTPNEFIQTIRLKRAAQLLVKSEQKIAEISYMVGFNNPKYFSKCFQKQFGCSPSKYKEQHTL
ncbi:two-component regulator propeller domain-containing protein [Echinicola sediminis]